jgi:hypothetical protein
LRGFKTVSYQKKNNICNSIDTVMQRDSIMGLVITFFTLVFVFFQAAPSTPDAQPPGKPGHSQQFQAVGRVKPWDSHWHIATTIVRRKENTFWARFP